MDVQSIMRALVDHKAEWGKDVLWANPDTQIAGILQQKSDGASTSNSLLECPF